ncbi:NHL repeat-containing protein [Nocardioides carbamazepini]|uniref:NHL repeat-containing protein n=1 Tax=Nocardioides carbamazepini TaxID=2854259 RepID=UPI00214A61C4|nr:NHL repeat-containing protein [Nocardioides carbamazepini]MCR1782405.1 NHL repeat-containing protein [Nocardioides carbamazepini]
MGMGVVAGLVVGVVPVAVPPAALADPAAIGYAYEREWLYSTNASEVPDSVAVDASGRVFLIGGTGDDGSVVRAYDAGGGLQASWKIPEGPTGDMTVDGAGNLRISDYAGLSSGTPGVMVYSPAGSFLRRYGMAPGESAGGIGLAPNGRTYVASPTTDQVVIFNADGSRYKAFGGSGAGPGQLDSPWALDVAPDGSVVVGDFGNDRISVFSAEGGFLRSFGQSGSGPGQFVGGPRDLEVRDDGLVVASDVTNRVQAFRLDGAYVGTMTATTKRAGVAMRDIQGLGFGPGRVLYVAGTLYPFENGVARYVLAGTGTGVAKVKAPKSGVAMKRKRLTFRVKCVSAAPCAGQLSVRAKGKTITKAKAYAIPAGATKKVKVTVTKKGLKVIRKKPTTKAAVSVTGSSKKVKIRR